MAASSCDMAALSCQQLHAVEAGSLRVDNVQAALRLGVIWNGSKSLAAHDVGGCPVLHDLFSIQFLALDYHMNATSQLDAKNWPCDSQCPKWFK